MLPFDTVAPSTPLFGVPRNMKEMKMCRWAVCSITCIRTSESGTLLPFSFSRSSRATLSAVSAVHSLVKASKTTLKHQNSLKSLLRLTARVNLSLVVVFARLLFQYGAVKRAIMTLLLTNDLPLFQTSVSLYNFFPFPKGKETIICKTTKSWIIWIFFSSILAGRNPKSSNLIG